MPIQNIGLVIVVVLANFAKSTDAYLFLHHNGNKAAMNRQLSHAGQLLGMNILDWPLTIEPPMVSSIQRILDDDFFSPHPAVPRHSMRIDVVESPKEYTMSVDAIPGISRSDINLELNDRQMVISFERKGNDAKYIRKERFYGKMTRTFELPEDADESNIKAHHENGVLTLHIPRTVEKNKARTIQITDRGKQDELISRSDGLEVTEAKDLTEL